MYYPFFQLDYSSELWVWPSFGYCCLLIFSHISSIFYKDMFVNLWLLGNLKEAKKDENYFILPLSSNSLNSLSLSIRTLIRFKVNIIVFITTQLFTVCNYDFSVEGNKKLSIFSHITDKQRLRDNVDKSCLKNSLPLVLKFYRFILFYTFLLKNHPISLNYFRISSNVDL